MKNILHILIMITLGFIIPAFPDTFTSEILKKTGKTIGVCSIPRANDGKLALEIAETSGMLVHAMDLKQENLDLIQKAGEKEGILGKSLYLEKGDFKALPFADNFIDLLLISDLSDSDLAALQVKEVARVITPYSGYVVLGKGKGEAGGPLAKDKLQAWAKNLKGFDSSVEEDANGLFLYAKKQALKGADDWNHYTHDPENNAFSKDTVLKMPLLTQWLGKPYLESNFDTNIVASGRIFTARTSMLFRIKNLPSELVARSAYNGQILWKKDMPKDYGIISPQICANAEYCFIFDGGSALILDAETGKEVKKVSFNGSSEMRCKWMAVKDDVLYWLVGSAGKAKSVWGNAGLSNIGPFEIQNTGTELHAYDTKSFKTLWKNDKIGNAERRSLCMNGEKIFFTDSKKRVVAVEAKTGKIAWSTDHKFAAGDGGGMDSWFMSSNFNGSLCTKDAYYVFLFENKDMPGYSAKDGKMLFEVPKKAQSWLMLNDKLFGGGTLMLDARTGAQSKADWGYLSGGRIQECGHQTASENGIFGIGGPIFDLNKKQAVNYNSAFKFACGTGSFVANGLFYGVPTSCSCWLNWRGFITLGSANDFQFDKTPKESDCLEAAPAGSIAAVDTVKTDEKDWHTYRGNNQRTGATSVKVVERASKLWEYIPAKSNKDGDIDNADEAVSSPVTAGDFAIYGGNDGIIRCFDISTGKPAWSYLTEGKIMGSPAVYEGRVYTGSADGHIYCNDIKSGKLVWRYRLAPLDRKIMVYGNLMSSWPVNTGVMVHGGVVYASAGLIGQTGTYVCALDAKTGKLKWLKNESMGGKSGKNRALSSVGCMAVANDKLILNNGNAPLVVFNLKNGDYSPYMDISKTLRFENSRGKEIGIFAGKYVFHGGRMLYKDEADVEEGRHGSSSGGIQFVFTEYDSKSGQAAAIDVNPFQNNEVGFVPAVWDDKGFLFSSQAPGSSGRLEYLDSVKFEVFLEDAFSKSTTDTKDKSYKFTAVKPVIDSGSDPAKLRNWKQVKAGSAGSMAMSAYILTENAVVTAFSTSPKMKTDGEWYVAALSRTDGSTLWSQKISGAALINGLAVDRNGNVVVTLRNGGITCLGKK
ncbi:MAG: hypothetical protein A2231_09695 [Candidatus Firestonebacteria bacterium RIFOXYA2_FULL_40_8]|nr:MAG: hypothetical protein A2231_09695 [Candidatus Firestonebacteria bacterium RIFOXYA2_FULL_40_8]